MSENYSRVSYIESNEQILVSVNDINFISVVYIDPKQIEDIILSRNLLSLHRITTINCLFIKKILTHDTPDVVNVNFISDFEGLSISEARKQVISRNYFFNNEKVEIFINGEKYVAQISANDLTEPIIKLTMHTRVRFTGKGIISINDIGGQQELINWYKDTYLFAMEAKEYLQNWKICVPRGLLLSGKPGLGKTHFMKALIADSGVYSINISAPDVITPLAGDGDKILEEAFEEARQNIPAVICIDEVDALCLSRSSKNMNYENRVVSVLLKEMDGLETRGDVLVIGTTNRVESIDIAFKRPGRFTYQIELNYPDFAERVEILKIHLKPIKNSLTENDFKQLARRTKKYTGAEIASLIQKAGVKEIKNHIDSKTTGLPELSFNTILSLINNKLK
jgi:SpoVK/Ycf46/Vps4 family AAA+-type ATPase